jgi:hypothetical protein
MKKVKLLAFLMLTTTILFSQITHPMIFNVENNGQSYDFNFGVQTATGWGITQLPAQKVTGQLVWGYDITPDSIACDTITNNYSNKIVMVRRGTCNFSLKMYNVQNSGAEGCIICNNIGTTEIFNMFPGAPWGSQINIPTISLSFQSCALIDSLFATGATLNSTFRLPFGSVILDNNLNCNIDSFDVNISGRNIFIQPGNHIVQSDTKGYWYKDSLPAGSYTATIDTIGLGLSPTCPINKTFNIISPNQLVDSINFGFANILPCSITYNTTINNQTCNLINDGYINLNNLSTNNTFCGGYHYLWSNGSTTVSISGLSTGSYTVTIEDCAGCIKVDTISVGIDTGLLQITPTIAYTSNGSNVIFSGQGMVNYQWQTNPINTGWVNLSDNNFYTGSTTSTLSITSVQLNNHNQPFRVIGQDGICIDTSNVVYILLTDSCVVTVLDTITTNVIVYDTLITYLSVTDTLVIISTISGLNPPSNTNTFLVYPNPSKTHITIDNGNFSILNNYSIKITSTLGQVVFNQPINQQQFYIDLSTWTGNGIYYLNILDNTGNIIETKIIVIQ